jgi:hypothetical protein
LLLCAICEKLKLRARTKNTIKMPTMSRLRNALGRLRRALPKTDFMKHKHEDCANFRDWLLLSLNPIRSNTIAHYQLRREKRGAICFSNKLDKIQPILILLNTNKKIKEQ